MHRILDKDNNSYQEGTLNIVMIQKQALVSINLGKVCENRP